jgi:hypothetical protein
MHSFLSRSLLAIFFLAVVCFVILGVKAVNRIRRDLESQDKHEAFWYTLLTEVLVPFAGPAFLALIGLWFSVQLENDRNAEAENQKKVAVLRETMTTRNGPDVAFFTAVGERLTIHIQRYEQQVQQANAKGLVGNDLSDFLDHNALFEEKAIYFYYGMFRVAQLDFLATKGYVLYPRIWMEQAFVGLMSQIVEDLIGAKERDISASVEEEAVLYRYFGASKATYHTASERTNETTPDLFEFSLILNPGVSAPKTTAESPYYALHVTELRHGFQRFQARLREGKIRCDDIIVMVEAMTGLDDYAFNTLFSSWYGQFNGNVPITLDQFLNDPPEDFLPYPLDSFKASKEYREAQEWCGRRKGAWQFVLDNVPSQLKEVRGAGQSGCASK